MQSACNQHALEDALGQLQRTVGHQSQDHSRGSADSYEAFEAGLMEPLPPLQQ